MKRALVVLACLLVAGAFGAGGYVIHEQQQQIDDLSATVHDLDESSHGKAEVGQVDTLRQETTDAFQVTLTRIEALETQVGDDIFSTALPGEGLEERLTGVEQDLRSAERRVQSACTALTLAQIFPAC